MLQVIALAEMTPHEEWISTLRLAVSEELVRAQRVTEN